ncbi:MAG: ATP-grasp domain-containing protein [Candidatus Methanoliparum thermophilum]|uniref:ATP-grasp domain-containing protein n=1 Tax=Methanoliparum thermophilum TaxID=2491083 RepID=A0A520KT73_METT2|nr:ATP-grasp domain-containing protein [Candidatus Methanoliparum sp. LAM-1]RZN65102.1 MAG: ATP-grasp domain-containing protein [Candidatus Methanoliparum thermophilum]BDC36005.1 ATP-dependent carboligase [Candidatus Methanoliparum sp. LAM-1]
MIGKILIIGSSVRHIVCSAKKAGYDVISIDFFDDLDLVRCDKNHVKIEDNYLDKAIAKLSFDHVVLSSHIESFDIPDTIKAKILGNPIDKMREVNNKLKLAERLDNLGYTQPKFYEDAKISTVMKPIEGGGGIKNRLIKRIEDIPEDYEGFFFQEYIKKGEDISVSCISNGIDTISLTANEQLIGEKFLNAPSPFTYCGNIVPYVGKNSKKIKKIASNLISDLELKGFNGVDFKVSKDKVYVIEVNPRICGSLDAIELSTGINIFDMHVKSSIGILPKEEPISKNFSARSIVFAGENVRIKDELDHRFFRDIPKVGSVIQKNRPITSITVSDTSRRKVLNRIKFINKKMLPRYLGIEKER